MAEKPCYHCGLPVPPTSSFSVHIDGEDREMCCPDCEAVAGAIVSGGLSNFYRFRTELNPRPDAPEQQQWLIYDEPLVQQNFVHCLDDDDSSSSMLEARLYLEGITCAACVWLIEHALGQVDGIESVRVNAASHRCIVSFHPEQIKLSRIMARLADIGYQPRPATDAERQALLQKENRTAMMRLGVAGMGMMQVGMVAIALYAGALQGMSPVWETFLRWVSLVIATPVVFYSAAPFFNAAWRSLKMRHLVMDLPISIAIGGAYAASCYATLRGTGEVYFDSVSMFTFFLLAARYLEMRARYKSGLAATNLTQMLPVTAQQVTSNHEGVDICQQVPLQALREGDVFRVHPGDNFPCDGLVKAGSGTVIEALFTGEQEPIAKQVNDSVIAGTIVCEGTFDCQVTAVGNKTKISAIEKLVSHAEKDKPLQVAMADRLAGYFVGFVLLAAVIVSFVWWQIEPEHALWVTLSVLVVTCPCALSLATPTVITAAVAVLRRHGLLVTRGHFLETVNRVTRVVFDKTGTLTEGRLMVNDVLTLDAIGKSVAVQEQQNAQVLAIAAALESGGNHPIARAFEVYSGKKMASSLSTYVGNGVAGCVDGTDYALGRPEFVSAQCGLAIDQLTVPEGSNTWLLLANNQCAIAWIGLRDSLRASAKSAVDRFKQQGIDVELLSGDRQAAVDSLADSLGIDTRHGEATPEQKLERLKALQQQGEVIMMVGDGVNDVPVLAAADISVAMNNAPDLAQTTADSVLLSTDLDVLPNAMMTGQKARRIIRQNLTWSLTYNSLALPLAAMGWVPPYLAAVGMSLSSLVVVLNALRVNREKNKQAVLSVPGGAVALR